jgi:hypothetical protein
MIPLEDLYFEWLLSQVDQDGVEEGVEYVCGLLHNCEFHRRVGNDINRAIDGADLRKEFLSNYDRADLNSDDLDALMMKECSWLEMLVALALHLDYLYEGGVKGRLLELINNVQIGYLAGRNARRSRNTKVNDQRLVEHITGAIDDNHIETNGLGGLFPLHTPGHQDQREVEIWIQQAAYFSERLDEGVLWTSTN